MKKNKINLIINREDYQKYENYFYYLKIAFFGFFMLFFIIFLAFLIILKKINYQLKTLELKKKTLLEYLKEKTTDTAKINYIEKKYRDLKTYLKDDAYSSPYYSLLNSALLESSQSAELKSFNINKNREVDFTLSFADFNDLRSFFKFIESKTFLDNFETISLKTLNLFGATELKKENYELSFKGRFIPLKETNN